MTVWIKRGVLGDLIPAAQKGFGRVADLYEDLGKDFFCTSIRDGNHGAGSLHYIGQAFDFRRDGVLISEIRDVLSRNFDVVDELDHYHVEYDPK